MPYIMLTLSRTCYLRPLPSSVVTRLRAFASESTSVTEPMASCCTRAHPTRRHARWPRAGRTKNRAPPRRRARTRTALQQRPVCAQHRPNQLHEGRIMHGAACHGCLLIAEPSCERRNELLDRSLVVPTVDLADAAFFSAGRERSAPILSAAALGALADAVERGALVAPFGQCRSGVTLRRRAVRRSALGGSTSCCRLEGGSLVAALRLAQARVRRAR